MGMYNYKKLDESKVEYLDIGPASEIAASGERLVRRNRRQPLVIFNIAGELFSIADVCSHDEGPVGEGDLEGYNITCPRHGAQFDVRTGQVTQMPAVVDIPSYPVRVVDGRIQLGLPKTDLKARQVGSRSPVTGEKADARRRPSRALRQGHSGTPALPIAGVRDPVGLRDLLQAARRSSTSWRRARLSWATHETNMSPAVILPKSVT